MLLPPVQGSLSQEKFFIYAACDSVYFDEFGLAFISSIRRNTQAGVHLHLFNPDQQQIDQCHALGATVTWEYVLLDLFKPAVNTLLHPAQLDRTKKAMLKGGDQTLLERMQKTYYACARFIRLQELFDPTVTTLELDVDAVVRREIPELDETCDFYIHHISGKKERFLAGGLYLCANSRSQKFLTEYAQQLRNYIERDYLYWGLDQDLLDTVVPYYQHQQLPMSLIDWNMQPESCVWTAKGTRKDLAVFKAEKNKYTA